MNAQPGTSSSAGGGRKDDPFYWSPERLLKELCTTERCWEAPPPRKWPDPDKLAEKLRQHDLDGETLMTLQDVAGRGGYDSFCRDLDIVKVPHKISLQGAIQVFQFRSPAYRAWKEARAKQSQMIFDDELPGPASPGMFMTPKKSRAVETRMVSPWKEALKPRRDAATPQRAVTPQRAATPRREVATPAHDVPNSDLGAGSKNAPEGVTVPPLAAESSLLSGKKRKRVIPINISAVPLSRANNAIEPMTETTSLAATNCVQLMWKTSSAGAFLGPSKLTQDDLLHDHDPLDPEAQDNAESEEDTDFNWIAQKTIPPGRRLQVHQTMKRFFRPRKSTLHLGRGRPSPENNRAGQAAGGDGDVVLPLLGESDDDEEYDTETWEAMLEEENERNNPQPRKNAPMSTEAIDAVIADEIRGMETKWVAKKLPGLRKRENALWMAARRSGSRRWIASTARIRAEALGRRIDKLVQEIRSGEYKSAAELRRLTPTLEQSVADKRRAMWEARLYARPTEPPKSRAVRRQHPLPECAVQPHDSDDDAETLTSSSDEDMRDFIFDDDAATPVPPDAEDMFVPEPSWSPEPMEVDAANSVSLPAETQEISGGHINDAAATSSQKCGPSDEPAAEAGVNSKTTVSKKEPTGDIQQVLLDSFRGHDKDQLCRLFSVEPDALHDDALGKAYFESARSATATITDDAVVFSRLFYVYITCRVISIDDFFPVDADKGQLLLDSSDRMLSFRVLARMLVPQAGHPFQRTGPPRANRPNKPNGTGASQSTAPGRHTTNSDADGANETDTWVAGDSSSDIEVLAVRPVRRQRNDSDFDDDDITPPPRQPKKRFIRRDEDAQELRNKDRERLEEQENRRKALYKKLAHSATISQDQSRLIINTAKEDHHGLVYINEEVGQQIRDHQIEGVRFMWNQLIVAPDIRQGCLLAHTMGLGKTMQVISLLVSMAEAAASPDDSVSSQIPRDLRDPKILILCPSGLVQNWLDELHRWTPNNLLGRFYYVAADMDATERITTVERWADSGKGVLVIGYTMFRRLISDFGDEIQPLLEKSPDIVIADEAHALKNPKSKVHAATANFATKARIAMTGSPLANAVEEYHSMINWVAPNYLADHREFVSVYANPINKGFYKDSTASQRRHAIKMLKVLKDTVAPKIHRATVASLKGELPPKIEFILYMPLTELQLHVYRTFIESVTTTKDFMKGISTTVQLWNILVNLTLLLAHPKVFQIRIKEMHAALTRSLQRASRSATDRNKKNDSILPPGTIRALVAAVMRRDLDNTEHSSKITVLVGILDEAKRIGDKVLVFSQSKLVLDYLADLFKRQKRRYSRLDGDTAISLRQTMVNNFNTGNDEIYLISTTAGGVGLNIQGANRVVIFDFKWNPIHEQQAVGRAYRIGQTKPVFVYWLVTGGTCETVLHNQAVFKTQLASRVVDKKNPAAWGKQLRDYTAEPTVMERDETIPDRFRGRDRVLDALLQDDVRKRCICKIVSTDTFEEEEPEDKLSPEELRLAAALVFQNKAGIRTAADAAKAGVPFFNPSFEERVLVPSASTSASASARASFAPGTSPGMLALPARPTVPATMPPRSGPAYWPVVASGTQVPIASVPTEPFKANPPPPPMQIPTAQQPTQYPGNHPNLGRTMGAVSPGQVSNPSVSAPPLAAHAPPPPPSPAETSALIASADDLKAVLLGTLVTRKVDISIASLRVDETVASIASKMQLTGVPALAQWARLRNRAFSDALFARAMVTGDLRPEFLATMSIPEEENAARQLHSSDSANSSRQSSVDAGPSAPVAVPVAAIAAAAPPATPVRVKDPDSVEAHLQRARDRLRAVSAGHNSRDLQALKDVVAKRERKLQQQQQRLKQMEQQQQQQQQLLKQMQQQQQQQQQPQMRPETAAPQPPLLSPPMANARLQQFTMWHPGDLPKPKMKSRGRPSMLSRPAGPPATGPPPPDVKPSLSDVKPPPPDERPPPPDQKRIGSNPQEPVVLD